MKNRIGGTCGACRVLAGKPGGSRPLGRLRWNDNIKTVLKKYVWKAWFNQVQGRQNAGNLLTA